MPTAIMTKLQLKPDCKVIIDFVEEMQQRKNNYFASNFETLTPPKLEVQQAIKYIKIWEINSGGDRGSIQAFIDRDTGEIFMPASTKAPAKKARGNVYADDKGFSAMDTDGRIRYLR